MKNKINSIPKRIKVVELNKTSIISTERIRGRELLRIRKRIGLRDDYECQMCGILTADGEVDHIIPLHLGGKENDENRQWLCPDCHQKKGKVEERERGGKNLCNY